MICRECLAVLGWQFVKDELRREVILGDMGFHAREGDPSNLKLGERGQWNERMMVETVLSMLTLVCHFKKVMHRAWGYFRARLGFTMAAFNFLAQWDSLSPQPARRPPGSASCLPRSPAPAHPRGRGDGQRVHAGPRVGRGWPEGAAQDC